MMTDAAHGTISAHRTSRRPGKASFRSCARPSDTTTVTSTTTTTQITVLATTVGSASCSRSRA